MKKSKNPRWQDNLAKYLEENPSAKKVIDTFSKKQFEIFVEIVKYSWDDGWHHGLPY